MAFQIKNFVSIVASMVNYARGTTTLFTDFSVGGKARTMLETAAIEIEELYQQMLNGLVQAIPVSVYNTFSFPLQPAVAASFDVTINLSATQAAQTLTAGTVLTPVAGSIVYTTASDIAIAANAAFVVVLVVASTAGVASNVPANTTFTVSPAPAGFVSAASVAASTNGADAETEAGRLQRFQAYIQTLARGTVAALYYGMSTAKLLDAAGNITERVVFSQVVEPWLTNAALPVGLVNCYIHNGVGNTSPDLVTQALAVIVGTPSTTGAGVPGYKAAGVQVTMAAATEQAVNVIGTIQVAANVNEGVAQLATQAAITQYLIGLNINQSCILAEIYALAMAVPGVINWLPSSPTADVAPAASVGYKIMPGVVTVLAG